MAKTNKLLSLIALPLLLSACDSSRFSKPSFSSYGKQVNDDTFTEKLEDRLLEVTSSFLMSVENKSCLKDTSDYLISYKMSLENKGYGKAAKTETCMFSDIELTAKIDNDNKRSESTKKETHIVDSNVSTDSNTNHEYKTSIYAELNEETFYKVDIENGSYSTIPITSPSSFASVSVCYCTHSYAYRDMTFLFNPWLKFFPSNDSIAQTKYYVNKNNTFTTVYKSSEGGHSSKAIVQCNYGEDVCSYKLFLEETTTMKDSKIKGEYGASFEIRKADISLNALDYSSFKDTTSTQGA